MWKPTKHNYGVVTHNWNGNVRFGLPLDIGDFVEILEENGGWFRGKRKSDSQTFGIFPKSFIRIKLKNLSKDDRLLDECTETLRVWYDIWKKLFVKNDLHQFIELQISMSFLIKKCKELRQTVFFEDKILKLQERISSFIDLGNRKMGLDLVPRLGTFSVNEKNSGIILLHQAYIKSAEKFKVPMTQEQICYQEKNLTNYHIYLELQELNHILDEDLEIYFYLFDATPQKMRTLSERFLIYIPGKVKFKQEQNIHSTIFTDLALSDLHSNLFVIITLIRFGKKRGYRKSYKKNYRQPYGMSVCKLSETINSYMLGTFNPIIHLKLSMTIDTKIFPHLHEFIIQKETEKYRPITSAEITSDMILSIKILNGDISQRISTSPLLSVTRKIGFAEIFVPSDIRNDLFLTLEKGSFEMGPKSAQKNIEVTVLPVTSSGKVIPKCLWRASNSLMDTNTNLKSLITYHNNFPCFKENVRIDISPEIIHDAHIRFEFRHCSTGDKNLMEIYGFSFLRLTRENGAIIPNGFYELHVYEFYDHLKYSCADYLTLPCYEGDRRSTEFYEGFRTRLKEKIHINIILCSMKLTQNIDILTLRNWRLSSNHAILYDSLTRLIKINNEELIKNLPENLEALLEILATKTGNKTKYSGSSFQILLNIFELLRSNKFKKYKPIINAYIEDKFSLSSVHTGFLSSIQLCTDCALTPDNIESIEKCFESFEYIFRFMIKSKKLHKLERKSDNNLFKESLHSVFFTFYKMLKIENNEKVQNIQIILLKKIELIFEQLKGTQPTVDLAKLIKNLLNVVPKNAVAPIVQAKLQAFKYLVSGYLFIYKESRIIILRLACTHLRLHMLRDEEQQLCLDIISEILIQLHEIKKKDSSNEMLEELQIICKDLLMILFENILERKKESENSLSPFTIITLGLIQELNETNYNHIWDDFCTEKNIKDTLMKFLLVFKKLLNVISEDFPKDWTIMKLAVCNVICQALIEFGKQLLNCTTFDYEIWWTYFTLTVSVITQPCLQLEQYEILKISKIMNVYGDMRVMMGVEILHMWSKLGDNKKAFIPSMIDPFIEITLIEKLSLRKSILTVFYDMMECEQFSIESLRVVQYELIDKLDVLINTNKADKEYKDFFCSVLLEKIESERPDWKDSSVEFISSIKELLEISIDLRSVIQGSENREKLMICIVNFLFKYDKNGIYHKEKYLRYIYKLYDLHIEAEDYAEAGFTLKLHFDMLSWDVDSLICNPQDLNSNLPEWSLKQNLSYQILQLFQDGKCWESAISICKELEDIYEMKHIDYVEVGNILKIEQACFQNILTEYGQDIAYFQVNFYGTIFPTFVQNKTFIYRGSELDFTEQLQKKFPQAEILTKNTELENSFLTLSGKFLQVTSVRPIGETEYFKNAQGPVPHQITKYHLVNNVKRFQTDRPIHKGPIDKNNEFKTMWIERTIFEIEYTFPGILKCFEVTRCIVENISPIEYACETIENVNSELLNLISEHKGKSNKSLTMLTNRIMGIIDANIERGIIKYQEAFFNKDFLKIMENVQHANKLKNLISTLVQILDKTLQIHPKIASADLLLEKLIILKQNSQSLEMLSELSESKKYIDDQIEVEEEEKEKHINNITDNSEKSLMFDKNTLNQLEILLDFRNVMHISENREIIIACIAKLLNFYKDDIHNKNQYLMYVYKLHELHMEVGDYTEAGFVLKSHFDRLSWNIKSSTQDNILPDWELKKDLCILIINLFQKGKCWQNAIPLCKELADFYTTKLINYVEVGKILKIKQTCFENILLNDPTQEFSDSSIITLSLILLPLPFNMMKCKLTEADINQKEVCKKKTLEMMLEILDYDNIIMEENENRNKIISCIVNLMNFYKDREKDKYLSYVYKLYDLHIEAEEYTEAAFTLKLHFDMLCWNVKSLTSDLRNSDSLLSECELKKKICYQIIDLFCKGKCWVKAISMCKLLASLYENRYSLEIEKIFEIQVNCTKNMVTQDLQEPTYFLVNFYGMGFPFFVSNKRFIYRGYELEQIIDFSERIQKTFPKAEKLTTSSTPHKSILFSPKQFLQITCVRPIADIEDLETDGVSVPSQITKFYLFNDVQRFQNDRRIHKGIIDKNNEIKSSWIERTILETDQPFPGILRWFEVTKSTMEEISPIQFACETMEKINRELLDLIKQYKEESSRPSNLNPFTMRLQGVIDASVQGGITKYQEAFFTTEFSTDMKNQQFVSKLKTLIFEQFVILENALDIHGKIVHNDIVPLHNLLIEKFYKLKLIELLEVKEAEEKNEDETIEESDYVYV